MKRNVCFLIYSFFLLFTISAQNKLSGKVVDIKNNPIVGASVYELSKDSTEINHTRTDSLGQFSYNKRTPLIRIRCISFKDTIISNYDNNHLYICLKDNPFELADLEVSPKFMEQYDTHRTYRIPAQAMEKYTSFYLALNEIPELMVSENLGVFYRGNEKVIILLNGVKTSEVELTAIDKSDISKVELYSEPPARFMNTGARCVINVITKNNLQGGNISIDLYDAVTTLSGNNNLYAFYNSGCSRLTLSVNNKIRHWSKYRIDEELCYTVNDTEYNKVKTGINSPENTDINTLSLSYINRKDRDYQFSTSLNYTINQEKAKISHDVLYSDGLNTKTLNQTETDYNKYSLGLYFDKTFKGNQQLLAEIVGSIYDTNFKSSYNEIDIIDKAEIFNTFSKYSTRIYSVISELGYSIPSKLGTIYLGAVNTWKNSKRKNTNKIVTFDNNDLFVNAQISGRKDKFSYTISVPCSWLYNSCSDINKTVSEVFFLPRVYLNYSPIDAYMLSLSYIRGAIAPSISMLSETVQWLDHNYIYHGNASLQPYDFSIYSIGNYFSSRHIDASLFLRFQDSPSFISDYFKYRDNNILETYVNYNRHKELSGTLTVSVYPWSNKILKLWGRIIVGRTDAQNEGYKWIGHRLQLMFLAQLNMKKWSCEASYQYPGKVISGHWVRPRAEFMRISGTYRPINNLSIGVSWECPFFKSFHESEYTTSTAPVHKRRDIYATDRANQISLRFQYNFSFGKNQKGVRKKLNNSDTDTGILKK